MPKYRRIYEQYHGVKIPKDHHIHHKDFNHENDDPLNLEALHKDVHAQKHGFLNNFIMAQASASERASLANKRPEVRKKHIGNKSSLGYKHTEEHNKKISKARIGMKFSVETRAKISQSGKGNKNSLGHVMSESSKAKISADKVIWWANKKIIIQEQQESGKDDIYILIRTS